MEKEEICLHYGHDWYISQGLWDKAKCLTCGRVIRDIVLHYSDLPNPRKN